MLLLSDSVLLQLKARLQELTNLQRKANSQPTSSSPMTLNSNLISLDSTILA